MTVPSHIRLLLDALSLADGTAFKDCQAEDWQAAAGLWLAREAFCIQIPEAVLTSLEPLGLDAARQGRLLDCILMQGMSAEAPRLPGETVGRFWATRGLAPENRIPAAKNISSR